MSRISTDKLYDVLVQKKQHYDIRVTAYIKGSVKDNFLNDCILRDFPESKMAASIIESYYKIINTYPDLKSKEPNEIQKFIIDRIKL
jgi:hypothetical protein